METKLTECAAQKGWQTGEEFAAHQFVVAFNEMQASVNKTAHDKGWYDSNLASLVERNGDADMKKELQNLEDSRLIALIHSEASEALENVRANFAPDDKIPQFSGCEAELADVIIRIMDRAQERGFRVADAIVAKAAFNKTRSYRHGNKAC
jgi:hypothetical protein